VQESYDTAKRILTEKRKDLDTLAKGLLEYETLTGEEIVNLLNGVQPVREDMPPSTPQPPRASPVPSTGRKPEPDVGGLEPHPV